MQAQRLPDAQFRARYLSGVVPKPTRGGFDSLLSIVLAIRSRSLRQLKVEHE